MIFFPSGHAVLWFLSNWCLAKIPGARSHLVITILFFSELIFAGLFVFVFRVTTNGRGAILCILLTVCDICWVQELYLRWVCFLPSTLTMIRGCSKCCLAEIPGAFSHVVITVLLISQLILAGFFVFVQWITANGKSAVSCSLFAIDDVCRIQELFLGWMVCLPFGLTMRRLFSIALAKLPWTVLVFPITYIERVFQECFTGDCGSKFIIIAYLKGTTRSFCSNSTLFKQCVWVFTLYHGRI